MVQLIKQVNKFFEERKLPLKVEYVEKGKRFNLILVKDVNEKHIFVRIKRYNNEELISLLIESSFEYVKEGIITIQQFEELFNFLVKLKVGTLIFMNGKLVPFEEVVRNLTLEDFQTYFNKKLKN